MENKQQMVAVTAYQASVKFEGRWYNSATSKNIEDVLNFVKRAREKTHSRNLPCNIVETVIYEPAQQCSARLLLKKSKHCLDIQYGLLIVISIQGLM